MPKPSAAERLAKVERAIRTLRADVKSLRRDLDERTRRQDRIGFVLYDTWCDDDGRIIAVNREDD